MIGTSGYFDLVARCSTSYGARRKYGCVTNYLVESYTPVRFGVSPFSVIHSGTRLQVPEVLAVAKARPGERLLRSLAGGVASCVQKLGRGVNAT